MTSCIWPLLALHVLIGEKGSTTKHATIGKILLRQHCEILLIFKNGNKNFFVMLNSTNQDSKKSLTALKKS